LITLDASGLLARQPLVLLIATNPIPSLMSGGLTTMSSCGVVPECGLVVEGITRASPASQVSCLKVQNKANGLAPSLKAIKEECKTKDYENHPEPTKYAGRLRPKGLGEFSNSFKNPFHHSPPYVSFYSCFSQKPRRSLLPFTDWFDSKNYITLAI
jgi:hypothetical protein